MLYQQNIVFCYANKILILSSWQGINLCQYLTNFWIRTPAKLSYSKDLSHNLYFVVVVILIVIYGDSKGMRSFSQSWYRHRMNFGTELDTYALLWCRRLASKKWRNYQMKIGINSILSNIQMNIQQRNHIGSWYIVDKWSQVK